MRICFLCEGYPPVGHGGIGTFIHNLARALVRAGHEVYVLGRYFDTIPDASLFDDEGVRLFWYRMPSRKVFARARTRYELFRTVQRWSVSGEIDLVEVPDCAGWMAGWPRLSVPVIARLHGSLTYIAAELETRIDRTVYWLERAALRRADFRCAVSHYAAVKSQKLFELDGDPPTVLYNPIEMPPQAAVPARSKEKIIYTGGFKINKGILSLLDAWPTVMARHPSAQLHIYGPQLRRNAGSIPDFVVSRLKSEIENSVVFHGWVDRQQLFRSLQTARAAIFPSYVEAFAQAPMEAMACGCPTVYTRRSSGPELIDHEQTGLLVDPDRPAEISDAIKRLLSDDTLAARLGEAGRKKIVQNFSTAVLVPRNVAFYRHCIAAFRRRQDHSRAAFWTSTSRPGW